MKFFESYSEHAYSALRIMAGAMFSFHGAQKVLGFMAEQQPPIGSQLWIGGVIELVGGLMIMTGLQAVWAAFVASGQMAVAYFQFHWKFQFGPEFFPAINHGELAVLYCFVFLYIAAKGSGKFSLDGLFCRKKTEEAQA
ncbi:MAG TPA: DoxX family protein [Acidobacteriota bacterium]|nr:DoxX family protein [Acidobacteriota bacterium]HNT16310.1 DoxX family protein [Acidobacteriota bacterium]